MTIPAHMQFSTLSLEQALAMYGDSLPPGWSNKLEEIVKWTHSEKEEIERLEQRVEDLDNDVEDFQKFRNEVEDYIDGISQTDDPLTIKNELNEILEMYGDGYTSYRGRYR